MFRAIADSLFRLGVIAQDAPGPTQSLLERMFEKGGFAAVSALEGIVIWALWKKNATLETRNDALVEKLIGQAQIVITNESKLDASTREMTTVFSKMTDKFEQLADAIKAMGR